MTIGSGEISVSAHVTKLALRYGNLYLPFSSASFDRCVNKKQLGHEKYQLVSAHVTKLVLRYGSLYLPFSSATFDRCVNK